MDEELTRLRRRLAEMPGDLEALLHYREALERAGQGWFGEPLEPGLHLGSEPPIYVFKGGEVVHLWGTFHHESIDSFRARLARRLGAAAESVKGVRFELALFVLDRLESIEHSIQLASGHKYGEGNDEYDSEGDIDRRLALYAERTALLQSLPRVATVDPPGFADWRERQALARAKARPV